MPRLSEYQDEAPKEPKESKGKMRLSDYDKPSPQEPTGWEKAGAVARGVATEVIGGPGGVESLITQDIPKFFGGSGMFGGETMFPTPKDVESAIQAGEKFVGVKPGVRPELEDYQTLGQIGSIVVPTGIQLGNLAKKAKDYYDLSKAKKATELANLLKTKMSGKVEDVIGTAETAQKAPEKRLGEIAKAQQELGGREKIAGTRQTAREQNVFRALDDVSKKTNVLAEDVGGVIQPAGQKNIASLKKTRESEAITEIKDPAFKDARARESQGDFIGTNPKSKDSFDSVLNEIKEQITRTPEPYASELRKRFSAIAGKQVQMSEGEIRAAQVRAIAEGKDPSKVATTKLEPMTLDQAEFLRRMLNNKDAFSVEGFQALDTVRQNQLADVITRAMVDYESRIGEYMDKYRSLSEPITRATTGRGKALTEMEIKAEQDALFSADKSVTARYFLDGTQEKAERLLDLVGGKKTEVVDAIKGHFRTQLEGMNSQQAEAFVRKNEGLLRVFPELRSPMSKVIDTKKAAETIGVQAEKSAQSAATRLEGESKAVQAKAEKAQKLEGKYRGLASELTPLTPKDSIPKARDIAKSLYKDGFINDKDYLEINKAIEDIHVKFGESAQAKQQIELLLRKVLVYGGFGAAGVGGYYGLKAAGQ